MRPLIGIPPCLDDRGRWREGRRYHYIDESYAGAVAEAGGVAVYLPARDDPGELAERLDGLLLPGGDDLPPPSAYPDGVRFDLAPQAQIAFDARLLEACLARRLPVFAICYGMQLLVRELGGELYYDLPTDAPEAAPHQLPERDGRHGLSCIEGTRLAAVLGTTPEPVNSLHHQGVRDPGPELRVAARADDGLIEAVEHPDGFCVAVQWHPEKLPAPHRNPLFTAFVSACR